MTILSKDDWDQLQATLTDEARGQQHLIHTRIGAYLASWSNTESLLLGLLERLLATTTDRAAIVYTALSTVHARRRTIVALARATLPPNDAQEVATLMNRFKTETAIRNSLAHAEYLLQPGGLYGGTVHYDLDNLERGLPLEERREWTVKRFREMDESRRRLAAIHRDALAIIHRFAKHEEPPQSSPG